MTDENPIERDVMNKLQPKTALARGMQGVPTVEDYEAAERGYFDGIDRPVGAISINLDAIEENLQLINGAIGDLILRLDPILGPPKVKEGAVQGESDSLSPMTQRLIDMRDTLAAELARIHQLYRRIEL